MKIEKSHLILVRHGKSEWNKLGIWTGLTDIPLTDEGRHEARKSASCLSDIEIHKAYCSNLIRAKETLDIIKYNLKITEIPTEYPDSLNERNYGIFTGKNKWDLKKELGDDEFQKLRRAWNYPIKDGETLRDVYYRVTPYYHCNVFPDLNMGKNVLIVSHNNTLRALVKYLENLSEFQVSNFEIGTAEIYIYQISSEGIMVSKEIRASNPESVQS